ncbi:hypothetical protein K437DRAFT_256724 [Tilletiaria anomala UBC 951]|uniref:Uncharacterized protein n=1 Tax=Tilletiaria anomala (strain ATCC 24038 / CBS 436.72 / UBC 951) TaxID=1037660 RepID=A0A066W1W2_TILAU|nr:uncharacterized protein K437DRAFT_256724 [Tilletiaria anomala UBC 951]KDN45069.1 hypothetical protein K437DRAFT_256724 [Tilletiaria anomala UBC 951]
MMLSSPPVVNMFHFSLFFSCPTGPERATYRPCAARSQDITGRPDRQPPHAVHSPMTTHSRVCVVNTKNLFQAPARPGLASRRLWGASPFFPYPASHFSLDPPSPSSCFLSPLSASDSTLSTFIVLYPSMNGPDPRPLQTPRNTICCVYPYCSPSLLCVCVCVLHRYLAAWANVEMMTMDLMFGSLSGAR